MLISNFSTVVFSIVLAIASYTIDGVVLFYKNKGYMEMNINPISSTLNVGSEEEFIGICLYTAGCQMIVAWLNESEGVKCNFYSKTEGKYITDLSAVVFSTEPLVHTSTTVNPHDSTIQLSTGRFSKQPKVLNITGPFCLMFEGKIAVFANNEVIKITENLDNKDLIQIDENGILTFLSQTETKCFFETGGRIDKVRVENGIVNSLCEKFSLLQKENGAHALKWMEEADENLCLEFDVRKKAELHDCRKVNDYVAVIPCTKATHLDKTMGYH